MTADYIAQPTDRTTLAVVESILSEGAISHFDVAAAYMTSSGVTDLLQAMEVVLGDSFHTVQKRWVTSFDYKRSDPTAIRALRAIQASNVRIHNAQFVLEHDCIPKVPFHPKAFFVRSNQFESVLTGSGNISRSGLTRGYEAGILLRMNNADETIDAHVRSTIDHLRGWFGDIWGAATPLTDDLLAEYEIQYGDRENLQKPAPVDDDVASMEKGAQALGPTQLMRLRACKNLWIQAGNITKNRGPNLPGNQLMMKRLTRVFFGFDAAPLPRDSAIGSIWLSFNGSEPKECALTFSNNGMDKLVLPIPVSEGPPAYDNRILIFREVGLRRFEISIAQPSELKKLKNRSLKIDAQFNMSSGRSWGAF